MLFTQLRLPKENLHQEKKSSWITFDSLQLHKTDSNHESQIMAVVHVYWRNSHLYSLVYGEVVENTYHAFSNSRNKCSCFSSPWVDAGKWELPSKVNGDREWKHRTQRLIAWTWNLIKVIHVTVIHMIVVPGAAKTLHTEKLMYFWTYYLGFHQTVVLG